MEKASFTLTNPLSKELAFKISSAEHSSAFDHITRYNYYSLLWIKSGKGSFKADFSDYRFGSNQMLFFTPYQPFMLLPDGPLEICALYWHSDFFCIEQHKKEVACNGVLFNNVYDCPSIDVPLSQTEIFEQLTETIIKEMKNSSFAMEESLISSLKLFLIYASRIKIEQSSKAVMVEKGNASFPLLKFKELIELYYKQKHSPSHYADILQTTTKTLGRLTKNHFNKTMTELIQERIIIEAKRELYLTDKSIKAIAYDLGFDDEHYFSRLFKKSCDISPQLYRETVGHNRLALTS